MATAGELKTLVTADTTQFNAGLARAGQQARGFGSGLTMQLQAVSAGVQDFAAVLGQGGANSLGRAFMATSNNISQFTASMGPWGAAIGGVAGVVASTLVPALLQAGDATFALGQHLKDMAADGDKFAQGALKGAAELRQFAGRAGKIDTAAGLREAQRELGLERQDAEGGFENARRQLQAFRDGLANAVIQSGGAKKIDLPEDATAGDLAAMDPDELRFRFRQFPDLAARGVELTQAFRDARRELEMIDAKAGDLKRQQPFVEAAEATKRMADELKVVEQTFARGRDLVDSWRTPFEKAQDSIREMAGLLNVGALTPDQFDRGADFLGRQFAAKDSARRDTGAMTRDSMDAARTILAATRPAVEQTKNAEAEAFRRFAEQQKDSVLELRRVRQAIEKQDQMIMDF